ncbi:MAG: hypothetical protein WA940_09620 [Sphingopyxis sp.]
MIILSAAVALSSPAALQCNAVTARGETFPLDLSVQANGEALEAVETLTSKNARLSVSNTRKNMRHGKPIGLAFDAVLDGRTYRGELGKGYLGRNNSTLNIFEVEGDTRGTPFLLGICGNSTGYTPVKSATYDDVAKDLSSGNCLAVTYGGRSFRYTWDYMGSESAVFRSMEIPEWSNQDVASSRVSPSLPNEGDIYRGFASLKAAPDANGLNASQFLYVNTESLKGTTFFDISNFSKGGGIEQMGRAHCGVDQMARG